MKDGKFIEILYVRDLGMTILLVIVMWRVVKSQKVLLEYVVSWNALIDGYAKQGQGHKVLDCFKHIQNDGIAPNTVTFICSLKACSNIGALDKGKQIHEEVVCRGLHYKDVLLGTALIDMYAICVHLSMEEESIDAS